jgi:hypothetical protein
MTKSEFYKKWYTREGQERDLNQQGYPNLSFMGEIITTEDQWTAFLENELELEDFARLDEEACGIMGVTYAKPYTLSRDYPNEGDQLDGIYKALIAVQASGIDLGTDATAYLDSVTAVKTEFPKN